MAFPPPCAPALRAAPRTLLLPLRAKRPRAAPRRTWSARAATSADDSARSTPSPAAARRTVRLYDVRDTTVPYNVGWHWQHALVNDLKANKTAQDALILLEHDPIYTLGTRSAASNVLFNASAAPASAPAKLVRTERGGEVTYHAPGQLVAYPVLRLSRPPLRQDLHWYMRALEGVVITVCAQHGLPAVRVPGRAGVWVGNEKVAAVGLKVSRWITMHGIALNVDNDMRAFESIVPCGIEDAGVASLKCLLGCNTPDMHVVRDQFVAAFADAFGPLRFRRSADPAFMR